MSPAPYMAICFLCCLPGPLPNTVGFIPHCLEMQIINRKLLVTTTITFFFFLPLGALPALPPWAESPCQKDPPLTPDVTAHPPYTDAPVASHLTLSAFIAPLTTAQRLVWTKHQHLWICGPRITTLLASHSTHSSASTLGLLFESAVCSTLHWTSHEKRNTYLPSRRCRHMRHRPGGVKKYIYEKTLMLAVASSSVSPRSAAETQHSIITQLAHIRAAGGWGCEFWLAQIPTKIRRKKRGRDKSTGIIFVVTKPSRWW